MNIPARTGNKKGGNKGIAKRAKEQRRIEAEARNAKTLLERTRAYRRRLERARTP